MKSLLLCLCLCLYLPALHAVEIAGMVKQHADHSKFTERPYGDGDFSYGAFLELFEGPAGWRFGAMYTASLSGEPVVDSVITPEISLLLQDGLWEAGVSVLIDYVDDGQDADWGDMYYQLQLGLNLPFGEHLSVGAHTFYPLDSFGNIADFRFKDLDYGVTLRLKF